MITEGMTPAQFISAINGYYTAINTLLGNNLTFTTLTTADDYKAVIDDNNVIVKTLLPDVVLNPLVVGQSGLTIITNLNNYVGNSITALTAQKLSVEIYRQDDIVFARSYYNLTKDIVHGFYIKEESNYIYPRTYTFLIARDKPTANYGTADAQQLYTPSGDQEAAINANGTLTGGAHAFAYCSEVVTATSKTSADYGSVFTDGAGRKFMLIEIKAGKHYYFPEWKLADGFGTGITGNLTYVSGGSDTNNVAVTSTSQVSYSPSTQLIEKYITDENGDTIADLETRSVQYLDVYFKYYIKNYKTIFDSVRTGFDSLDNLGWSSTKYHCMHSGMVPDELQYYFLETPVVAIAIGTQQFCLKVNATYPKCYAYMPDTKAFSVGANDYDFDAGQLLADVLDTVYFDKGLALKDDDVPVRQFINNIWNTSNKKVITAALVMLESSIDRGLLAETWIYNHSNVKSAPITLIGSMATGVLYTFKMAHGFYDAVRNDNTNFCYWVKTDAGFRVYINYQQSTTNDLVILPEFLTGKTITVVEKDASVTLNSSVVEATGIDLTVAGGYGNIVMDLT
jgi:hypothetical protein